MIDIEDVAKAVLYAYKDGVHDRAVEARAMLNIAHKEFDAALVDARTTAGLIAERLQQANEQISILEAENARLAKGLDMDTLAQWITVKACLDAAFPEGHTIDREKFERIQQTIGD